MFPRYNIHNNVAFADIHEHATCLESAKHIKTLSMLKVISRRNDKVNVVAEYLTFLQDFIEILEEM